MDWDDRLREEIVASQYQNKYPSTEAEIIQAYQQKYPGKEGRNIAWKKHLREDILAQRGITPENTDKKEYARQSKNLGKRFESRASQTKARVKAENAAEYEAIGRTLPPEKVAPENINYTVHVWGEIRISSSCRPVDF